MVVRSYDSAEDYGVPVPALNGSRTMANMQGTALAPGSILIDQCLSRLFVAAYLLTGSAKLAAGAMSEGTRLSWKAIAAAIQRGTPDAEEPPDAASTILPIELRRVLRLSPRLRQCFVLRLLMAMPRQYCAGLLGIDAREVDAASSLAAQELANMADAD